MSKQLRVPDDSTPKRRGPRKLPSDEVCSDDLQKLLGRNLRVARLRQGMTLGDVAAVTGMTHQSISAIERGEINLTILTLKKLITAVNLAPVDIFKAIQAKGWQ